MNTSPTITRSADQTVSDLVLEYLDRGIALPGELYTDANLFADEVRAIFGRQWLYAGHVAEIPEAGDYLTVDVGDESCIVTRARDGEIHAVLNVCRHRGARIVDGCGHARRLVCPYHQWTYDMDGHLAGAPRMPTNFDKSEYPLKHVQSAVWNGLIFINFAPDSAEDLADLMSEPAELMEPFNIAAARIAHTETYEVEANWKLVWENSQECYHCNANHPEFIKTFDMSSFNVDDVEPAKAFTDDRRMQWGTFPLRTGAVSLTMTGAPASNRLLGEFAEGRSPYTAATHLKPGFAAVFSPDYGIVFTDIPLDVGRTRVRVQWLVSPDAEEGVDYEVENLKRVWDQTNRQDWELCRSVQRGVRSTGFDPGPLSLDETAVAGFYYSYARMLSAAGL